MRGVSARARRPVSDAIGRLLAAVSLVPLTAQHAPAQTPQEASSPAPLLSVQASLVQLPSDPAPRAGRKTAELSLTESKGGGPVTLKDLAGIYTGDGITVTIWPNGYAVSVLNESNIASVVTRMQVTDGVVTVLDLAGGEVCAGASGSYGLTLTSGALALTALEDPCAPRRALLSGRTLNRLPMPD